MALIKCPECGNQVSTAAASCPKCGAPIHKVETAPEKEKVIVTPSASPAAIPPSPDEERQVFELKPTAKAFLGEIIFGILLIPVFLIGVIILLNVWYKVASLRYRLTSQRLFIQKGLIAKHLEELELFRVKDVTVEQGILQRLLGFGTIIVLSTDDSNPQVALIGINKPLDVKETIRNSFRTARKREGVRMAEFIHS